MFCFLIQEAAIEGDNLFTKTGTENPFLDAFHDPLCKLNLKETSEFVRAFPVTSSVTEDRGILEVSAQRREGAMSMAKRNVEAPPTPGRPVFSFSVGNLSKKAFPSKWDDAEKWLFNGSSCHDSPAHHHNTSKISRHSNVFKPQKAEDAAEKSVVMDEKISKAASGFQGLLPLDHHYSADPLIAGSASADVLLKGQKLFLSFEPSSFHTHIVVPLLSMPAEKPKTKI